MTELCDALSAPKEELAALWSDTFGDPRALPLTFLEKLPAFGFGWAAMEGGHVLGAAYGVDAFTLGGEKIAYLYAVAVRPDARGQGLGAALSRAVFDTARQRGAVYRCTEPAEPSLFDWYERILGIKPVLFCQKTTLAAAPGLPVSRLDPADYLRRREGLLAGRCHMSCPEELMAYEEQNCLLFDGGLYAVGDGIAAGSPEDGTLLLRECLGSRPDTQAAAVAAALGCERVEVRTCADRGTPFLAGDRPFPPGTVWNLALD